MRTVAPPSPAGRTGGASAGSSIGRTIGWGVFCACSWTWCIGMYLPKVMLERYGWPGFLVFAIPNVIGCAGFGYVLATRERSRAMTDRHPAAIAAFSAVAIAFHLFWIVLLLTVYAGATTGTAVGAAAVVLALGLLLARLGDGAWLGLSGLVFLVSIAAFTRVGFSARPALEALPVGNAAGLAWLSPAIIAGFLLCPYLDGTFHRALQRAPSRHAFGVFGAAFGVMIVLTCFLWFAPSLSSIAFAHLVAQATFTVGAHQRELRESPALRTPRIRVAVMVLPFAAAFVLPAARAIPGDAIGGADEVYLRFLVFYGLAFPLYVLLFVGPWRPLPRTPRTLTIAAAITLACAPMYELAYIHGREWLIAFPAAALVAWAVLRRRAGPS